MKRTLLSMLISLALVAGISQGHALAQFGTPPDFDVGVALGEYDVNDETFTPKDTFVGNEPIFARISLIHNGTDVFMPTWFEEQEFHLQLELQGPDGPIPANYPAGMREGPPPLVKLVSGELLQVDEVETYPGGYTLELEPFNLRDSYDIFSGGSYWVKAVAHWRTYSAEDLETVEGATYGRRAARDGEGDFKSDSPVYFTLIADGDGDGYCYPVDTAAGCLAGIDCDDTDPTVNPGAGEISDNGKDDDCNPETSDVYAADQGTLSVRAKKYTLDWGSRPRLTKEDIEVPFRVYDNGPGSCVQTHFGPSWRHRESIWRSCIPAQAVGDTHTNGTYENLSLPPGDWMVIAMDNPSGTDSDGDEVFAGKIVNDLESNQTKKRTLRFFQRAKGKRLPCRHWFKTGSELTVIEPEYVEWDGTEELYPFVFESEGDWDVNTSVAPPEGFETDHDSLAEEVNTEVKAVQFTITDVGSDLEAPTEVTFEVIHKDKKTKKEKKETIKSQIDVKWSQKMQKKKGCDKYGKKKKKKKKK